MSSPKPEYLTEFLSLNAQVSLYTSPTPGPDTHNPTLIVLCTWLFASRRHIAKYTQLYQTKIPHADILLIEPKVGDMIWTSDSMQRANLSPAATVIQKFPETSSGRPSHNKLVFHAFSNAGSHAAVQLSEALNFSAFDSSILSCLILDSCPGGPSAVLSGQAMISALPNTWLVRVTGAILIYLIVGVVAIVDALNLYENAISKTRRALNNPARIFLRSSVPRVYLYSKTDRMVQWRDILQHADEARLLSGVSDDLDRDGLVRTVEFAGSGHVGHLAVDGEKYWDSIASLF